MAEIKKECLESLVDMGMALGTLHVGMKHETADFVEVELEMVQNISTNVLQDCPHPPNVASNEGAPRQFQRELGLLRAKWNENTLQENLDQVNELRVILNMWVDGMTGATPSASFYGGGVPGTIPTGEPTWMADPYQVDTSGQFIRKYPSAWRNKKARTRVTSQKRIGAKV